MLTVGSLFSGIGGFDLGFEQAGMKVVWQCEIDEKASRVLARHWPDVPNLKDVRLVNRDTAEAVDVICGGFPCQDVSVAGRRAGLAGKRSGLWFEFHRVIGDIKPRWVVIENVPGLLSSNGGRDFAVILRGLVECGYGVCWRVLDAQYFGLAQRRKRVFIVGSLGDGSAAQVLLESESGGGDTQQGGKAGQDVAYPIRTSLAKGSNNDGSIAETLIASTIDAQEGRSERGTGADNQIVGTIPASGAGVSRPAGQGNELDFLITAGIARSLPTKSRLGDGQDEDFVIAKPLMSDSSGLRDNGGDENFVYGIVSNIIGRKPENGGNGKGYSEELSPTLDGAGAPASAGAQGIRRLMPVECERLQGFPDGWTDLPQADSARYKQLGNAVAVVCAKWIGERLIAVNQANNEQERAG